MGGVVAAASSLTNPPDETNRYVVLVAPGTYIENVVMEDYISVAGYDIEATTVAGSVEWGANITDQTGNEIALLTVSTLNTPAIIAGAHTDAYIGIRSCYITTTWDRDDVEDGIQDLFELESGYVEIYGDSFLELIVIGEPTGSQITTLFHGEDVPGSPNEAKLFSIGNTHIVRSGNLTSVISLAYSTKTNADSEITINGGYSNITLTEIMTANVAPSQPWLPGTVVTGSTSNASCIIQTEITPLTYVVYNRIGAFTGGETIGTPTFPATQTGAFPNFGAPHTNSVVLAKLDNAVGEVEVYGLGANLHLPPTGSVAVMLGDAHNSPSRAVVKVNYSAIDIDNVNSATIYFGRSSGIYDSLKVRYSKMSAPDVDAMPQRYTVSGSAGDYSIIGSSADDLYLTGKLEATTVTGSFSGSGANIFGVVSSSYAISSSYAQTASLALSIPIVSGAIDTTLPAYSGSFTGSFTGSATFTAVTMAGPFSRKFDTITGSAGLDNNDIVSVTLANSTITLPTAVSKSGRCYVIDNDSTGSVILSASVSQTVQGSASLNILSNTAIEVVSNGTNWRLI